QEDAALAATILNRMEDHGEADGDLWSLYGLSLTIPAGWALEKHQLMAGYTMLQFRRADRILRAERWGLANVALKEQSLEEFLHGKSRKFWREYRLRPSDWEWRGHTGVTLSGPTRKWWVRVSAAVRRVLKKPAAEMMTVRAWHCDRENKVFALHAVHPRGEMGELERVLASLACHG
ncbi:MAG: hypothetical protein QHJ73_09450, partial [Armatimonadota bacterium]|nr:hypothetical protein [Armatimonadota bacterium]